MNRLFTGLLGCFLFTCLSQAEAQPRGQSLKASIELQGEIVRIRYDLSGIGPGEVYHVWLEITDAQGNLLSAGSLEGDVGKRVMPGEDKEIIWNHQDDGADLDLGIYIQVFAEAVKASAGQNEWSTAALVLQSLPLPGLGLSRTTGKPHWIRGLAGYACLGSTIGFNRVAMNRYEEYQMESDIAQSDHLFDQSHRYDQMSELFAYTAIGIWVCDIVWNLVGSSGMKRGDDSWSEGFSLNAGLDTRILAPTLVLRYSF
jgi:hypothetical protein